MFFSKKKEVALARMVAHICLATDSEMWENPNYFELVMFDQDRYKCVGTTMLLDINNGDGKKYLLFNPNPSIGILSEVSAKRMYASILNEVKKFASQNNFDGILVNPKNGYSTNRGGLFLQALQKSTVKTQDGVDKKINLTHEHSLGKNYKYKDDLSFVWEK